MSVCDPTQCASKCCASQNRCGTQEECYPANHLSEVMSSLRSQLGGRRMWCGLALVVLVVVAVCLFLLLGG